MEFIRSSVMKFQSLKAANERDTGNLWCFLLKSKNAMELDLTQSDETKDDGNDMKFDLIDGG